MLPSIDILKNNFVGVPMILSVFVISNWVLLLD